MNNKADPLADFQFNEGSGNTTTSEINGYVGILGVAVDPALDTVTLVDDSPSGTAGDRSMRTSGGGFLLADDSAEKVLNIPEGPITMETWTWIDPDFPGKPAEGILAYGGSYKMGLRNGSQVFTLYGIVDIVNNTAGVIPVGEWVHLAAAWEPGVGVHFFVNGEESFEPNTNTVARATQHNFLSLGSEGLGNNLVAIFDRMRIHHELLTAEQIDSVAAEPKAPLPSTVVSYNFDQADLPATNSLSPALPAVLSSSLVTALTGPDWTTDTPSGAPDDFALSFMKEILPSKEVVTVNTESNPIDLAINNTSYTLQTWVKLPTGPMEERRVILRSNGDAPRIALSVNANRTLHTTILGTADFTSNVQIPNDNRWHHLAVTMDNFDQLRFYLDGALRQTVTRTQTGAPSAGGTPQLLIGKESDTRFFRGLLDRVKIDNTALTAEELDSEAVPGAPRFASFADQPASLLVNSGDDATFTATPTGATGYQWYYRTNLADATGRLLEGETGTSLTVANVGPEDLGYYYLVATNETGRIESYAAQLRFRSSLALNLTGFEAPDFQTGMLEGQNGWTTDANGGVVRVLNAQEITNLLTSAGITPGEVVHGGEQALFIGGPLVASTTTRQVTGLENEKNVKVDFWVRPLSGATVGNVFITAENANGTRAAGVRFGPNNSIDYGTAISGVWQATGLTWNADTWYHITMNLDYDARTYDFLVDGQVVNTSPIPFYTATSDVFTYFRVFRGAGQAGILLDDVSVTAAGSEPAPTLTVQKQGNDLLISWPTGQGGFVLEATEQLVPATWVEVAHTVNGATSEAVVQTTGESRFFRLVKE